MVFHNELCYNKEKVIYRLMEGKDMNIKQLFDIQRQLDEAIIKNHNLYDKDLLPSKILALEVELGELANETRCFKFWSRKPSSSKSVVLEEYVDCLHFLLSIGLDEGFSQVHINMKDNPRDLVYQFQDIFNKTTKFYETLKKEDYIDLFEGFLSLGKKLGFSSSEIEKAYLIKNQVNHQRQAEGY